MAKLTLDPKNRRRIMRGDQCIAVAQSTPANPPEAWENAAELVLAVNHHDELISALQHIAATCEGRAKEVAEAVLSKVT